MSIPLLSPAETPIYDDLIIEDMEAQFRKLPCVMCADAATTHIAMRCCGRSQDVCDAHVERWRAYVTTHIGVIHRCKCGHAAPLTFDDYVVTSL